MEQQLYHNETAIDALMKGGAPAGGFGGDFSDSADFPGGTAAGYGAGGTGGAGPSAHARQSSSGTAGDQGESGTGTSVGVRQELPPALPEEIKKLAENWSKYASETPPGSRRLALSQARLSLGDHGQLLIVFAKEYGNPYIYQRKDDDELSRARVDNDRRELQRFLQRKVGKALEIEYRVLDRGSRITDNYVDLLSLVDSGAITMPIETEDE